MQDKRKMKMFLVGVVLLCFVVLGVVYLSFQTPRKKATLPPQTTSTSTQVSQTKEKTETKKETTTKETLDLKEFLEVYFSWQLTETSIDTREKKLEKLMTKELYETEHIKSDSETLKSMVKKYNEKKEINTSNSTQLLERKYGTSKIYQSATEKEVYAIDVTYTEKAPYQEKGFSNKVRVQLIVRENRVAKLIVENKK